MTIGTNDAILKFGTQDEVTSGTPATIADNAFGKADHGASVNWTNDDDAPFGNAVLKCQFDTTFPTVGTIALMAHLLDVQSTSDTGAPDANKIHIRCGEFPIDFGIAADTDLYTVIELFKIPMINTNQRIDWYLYNVATGQTIGVSWQLWITPVTQGPHA